MSVSTSSVRFKNFLNATADQIHSRYEVETVLNDIVQTVELYNNQSDLYTLKKNYGVSKSLSLKLLRTIDVLDNENRNIRSELNVIKKKSSIVREKFALQISSILKESKQLSTHKSTITSLERRLADMEREYTIAKDKVSMQETVSSIVDFSNHLTGQIQSLSSSKSVEPSSEEATTNVTIASPISTPSHPSLESLAITNTSIEIQQENSFPLPDPSTTSVVPIAVAQAPVSKPTVYIVKTLLSLEDQVFLNTFSFLTTVEVLNFAQSCRMLFRRVNQLFGMESQVHMDTWTLDFERYSTHPNEASSSSEGPESRISSESTDKSMPESQISTATKSDLTLSQSIASSIFSSPLIKMATGGKLGVFPSTQSAQPSPTPAAVVTTVSKSTNINGTSGSSSSASAASTTTSTNIDGSEVSINSNGSATNGSSSQSGSVTTTSGVQPGGLSREMAEQFAKKLNAAELTAIKALSDLLRKQTGQMTTLREEKELVETKLQSTESMRDFLVEKLRSAEQALKSTFGDLAAARNQYAVDQEVINYLDLRGQELDAHNGQLRKELERLNAMHELHRGRHSHSESRLLSEVAECRSRLDDRERDFKAQKRLLVKEVKALRQQADKATTEKNMYRSQLQALRDALLVAGNSSVKS